MGGQAACAAAGPKETARLHREESPEEIRKMTILFLTALQARSDPREDL